MPSAQLTDVKDGVLAAYRRHVSSGMARLAEFTHANVEARSLGAYVWDHEGERYLECGGYGVFLLGHCHPRVVEAVVEQVRSHPLSTRLLLDPSVSEAAEALAGAAPGELDHVHFATSGAEAVEIALKLARLHRHRRVIAMHGGYHGKTLGALSVTGNGTHRDAFEPLLGGVEFVPFGDADALAEALASGPEACVILEPVQAEAGVIVPPAGYLADVERACRSRGAFLIADEIQTGLGRIGAWWGVEREGVVPDVLLAGKALSGGVVPVSAVVASEAAFGRLTRDPIALTSTFAGSPIAMAAAKAAIETIKDEDLVTRAAMLGERLHREVANVIRARCGSLVREVRGAGLLIGIEWKAEYLAFDFLIEMLDRRVLVAHSLNAPAVTRLTPPAILSDDDAAWLIEAVAGSAEALAGR